MSPALQCRQPSGAVASLRGQEHKGAHRLQQQGIGTCPSAFPPDKSMAGHTRNQNMVLGAPHLCNLIGRPYLHTPRAQSHTAAFPPTIAAGRADAQSGTCRQEQHSLPKLRVLSQAAQALQLVPATAERATVAAACQCTAAVWVPAHSRSAESTQSRPPCPAPGNAPYWGLREAGRSRQQPLQAWLFQSKLASCLNADSRTGVLTWRTVARRSTPSRG